MRVICVGLLCLGARSCCCTGCMCWRAGPSSSAHCFHPPSGSRTRVLGAAGRDAEQGGGERPHCACTLLLCEALGLGCIPATASLQLHPCDCAGEGSRSSWGKSLRCLVPEHHPGVAEMGAMMRRPGPPERAS